MMSRTYYRKIRENPKSPKRVGKSKHIFEKLEKGKPQDKENTITLKTPKPYPPLGRGVYFSLFLSFYR